MLEVQLTQDLTATWREYDLECWMCKEKGGGEVRYRSSLEIRRQLGQYVISSAIGVSVRVSRDDASDVNSIWLKR